MGNPLGRLERRFDFLRVAATRCRQVTPAFIIQAAPSDKVDSPARIGFTASRKVGIAVKRNRAKRRLRALANSVLSKIALSETDYVIIARQTTPAHPFHLMERDLRKAVAKINKSLSISVTKSTSNTSNGEKR